MVLAGFASFAFTVQGRANQTHNSTAHADRAVSVVLGYCEDMNGRVPGSGLAERFARTLRGATMGLRKLYTIAPMRRIPFLVDDIRAV